MGREGLAGMDKRSGDQDPTQAARRHHRRPPSSIRARVRPGPMRGSGADTRTKGHKHSPTERGPPATGQTAQAGPEVRVERSHPPAGTQTPKHQITNQPNNYNPQAPTQLSPVCFNTRNNGRRKSGKCTRGREEKLRATPWHADSPPSSRRTPPAT